MSRLLGLRGEKRKTPINLKMIHDKNKNPKANPDSVATHKIDESKFNIYMLPSVVIILVSGSWSTGTIGQFLSLSWTNPLLVVKSRQP